MSHATALLPTNPTREPHMEELNLPVNIGGAWGTLGFAITVIGLSIGAARAWWRKNNVDNADAGAHIDSIKNLQAILAAEREDHAKETASLREENSMLRQRADQFAQERNEWVVKFGELSGELRAVRAELESVKAELTRMREQNANAKN